MPKLEKSLRREKARERAQRGMQTVGRSVFTIQRRLGERAVKPAKGGRTKGGRTKGGRTKGGRPAATRRSR